MASIAYKTVLRCSECRNKLSRTPKWYAGIGTKLSGQQALASHILGQYWCYRCQKWVKGKASYR